MDKQIIKVQAKVEELLGQNTFNGLIEELVKDYSGEELHLMRRFLNQIIAQVEGAPKVSPIVASTLKSFVVIAQALQASKKNIQSYEQLGTSKPEKTKKNKICLICDDPACLGDYTHYEYGDEPTEII